MEQDCAMTPPEGAVKLLYITVLEDDAADEENTTPSFRYTHSVLQNTLQLMGCKPRHAFKISKRVFEMMNRESFSGRLVSACLKVPQDVYGRVTDKNVETCLDKADDCSLPLDEDKSKTQPFELYKRRTTLVIKRRIFLDVVCEALSEYQYLGPNKRADLAIACRIRERKESVTVLLCGASGCGKSTLSALLGGRLGITTIVSTDSIRHMMRSFVDETQNPLVWASTYRAGEYLDPVAVAEAKAKIKAKKSAGTSGSISTHDSSTSQKSEGHITRYDLISQRLMAIEGFKAQSEMVIDSLDRLITAWEKRKESVIVEGVHLSLNFVMGLMKKHPSIVPFMIYISSEEKHMERFAVRAKYMTLDPAKNKYVKYIRNIRTIQEYLCNRSDKKFVPKINNTNVDKSVAIIHATIFSCLRRRAAGHLLYDASTNTVSAVNEEYRAHVTANSLSSKGMFQLIQRKGSSRRLMALVNNDGSVAKAWPLDPTDETVTNSSSSSSRPLYGPLQIGKSEHVNLQFGHLGISAWPNDTVGTSYTGSVDESRGYLTDSGSRCFSSASSSPKGLSKELMEEMSDGEGDSDDDDDVSDEVEEELEGSVDEEYTKSDEEYDDLAWENEESEVDLKFLTGYGNCRSVKRSQSFPSLGSLVNVLNE